MGLSCGMKCVKYLLFAFNFIFWGCGTAVLGVGIYSRIKAKDWSSILGNDGYVLSVANLLIASGAVVMVIGFLGCCGAIKENKTMLASYVILLSLIFLMEIAAGIYAYVKKDKVLISVATNIKNSVIKEYGGSTFVQKGFTDSVDYIQKQLKCCGAETPMDWSSSTWYKNIKKNENDTTPHIVVPNSCCAKNVPSCNVAIDIPSLPNSTYSEGCIAKGKVFVNGHILEIGGVGFGIALIQILGISVALMLRRNLR
ncbi:CD151 antigen-like [Hydra vulgaris]|uniref:Tetraspanin n=1 Tax=Hydra vulgaris TaxID=6087 RepID=A0ABM4BBT6_HYDVU